MKPARGVTFVKKIEAHDQIGSIVIPQQTVEKMTAMQWEVVAVGEPSWCDEDGCKRPHETVPVPNNPRKSRLRHLEAPRLHEGAWVLLTPRSWVETPSRGVYATTTDLILGVYAVSDTGI